MNSGFTLVEIAMVLFIITLLLAGLVPTISSQLEQQRASETRKKMAEIKEALMGYALINGRLPCPARAQTAAGTSFSGINAGVVVSTTACAGADGYGVIPWVTLGTSETDGWGNRFSYRVAADFADTINPVSHVDGNCTPSPPPTQATFGLCSSGDIKIQSTTAAGWTYVAVNPPAIIISHGKNGAGAWTQQGSQLPVGTNADEVANTDHSSNLNYVSHNQTSDFDDQVEWISLNILNNRMVSAGKLP